MKLNHLQECVITAIALAILLGKDMQQYSVSFLGKVALTSQLYASIKLPQLSKMHTQVTFEHA